MMEILLLVIVILLMYWSYRLSKTDLFAKKEKKMEVKSPVIAELLPTLKGRSCEFIMRVPTAIFGYEEGKGVVLDVDEEWVLIETPKKKNEIRRVLRISEIKDVYEIRDT